MGDSNPSDAGDEPTDGSDLFARDLRPGDVRLRETDDGPALDIGGARILLRTVLKVEDDSERLGDRSVGLETEIDCDEFCWFNLNPPDDRYPWLTIQPEVDPDGGEERESA